MASINIHVNPENNEVGMLLDGIDPRDAVRLLAEAAMRLTLRYNLHENCDCGRDHEDTINAMFAGMAPDDLSGLETSLKRADELGKEDSSDD